MTDSAIVRLDKSAIVRRAEPLLLLANFGKSKPETIIAKITQETLAEVAGATPLRGELFCEQVSKTGTDCVQRRC